MKGSCAIRRNRASRIGLSDLVSESDLRPPRPRRVTGVRYSFVIPVYDEAEVLPMLFERMDRLLERLDGPAEVILVNDGSRDTSLAVVHRKTRADARYRVLNLSRNFGHQIAITAGLDSAAGSAVIVMDADLQDPPEVVLEMIETWKTGFDVVSARRERREQEGFAKRFTAHLYYRFLRRMTWVPIEQDVGDFRLLDRKVVDALGQMREQDRFVRGMVSWLGFRQTSIGFVRPGRAAGSTKYPFFKMLRLAMHGVLGFSDVPLRMALWCGALVSVLAICYGVFAAVGWLIGGEAVQGWTSTVVILSFLGGINLMMVGIVGLYVGRIHEQVKGRPLYIVDDPAARAAVGSTVEPVTAARRPGAGLADAMQA